MLLFVRNRDPGILSTNIFNTKIRKYTIPPSIRYPLFRKYTKNRKSEHINTPFNTKTTASLQTSTKAAQACAGRLTINRVAITTTINRVAIITTINRVAINTTINRVAINTTINRIAIITTMCFAWIVFFLIRFARTSPEFQLNVTWISPPEFTGISHECHLNATWVSPEFTGILPECHRNFARKSQRISPEFRKNFTGILPEFPQMFTKKNAGISPDVCLNYKYIYIYIHIQIYKKKYIYI